MLPPVLAGAFIVPFALPRYKHNTRQLIPSQLHRLRSNALPVARVYRHARASHRVVALQARAVSGDSDDEIGDQIPITASRSYSVGLTLVSGFDAHLRRSVVERIVADADAGRIVVVTMGGITSTDETDGPVTAIDSSSSTTPAHPTRPVSAAAQSLNGADTSSKATTVAAAVNNLEGWISCSSADEMVEVLLKLASSRECDYIVAECATDAGLEGHDLAQVLHSRGTNSIRVDTVVSVLDGDTVLQDLSASTVSTATSDTTDEPTSTDASSTTSQHIHDSGQQRPMIVVSLVENSNVVVIKQNPDDRPEQLSRVCDVISALNGSANIVAAMEGPVPVELLVNTHSYSHDIVKFGATWKKVLLASRKLPGNSKPILPKAVKEATFLYQARRPFHPGRLYEHFKDVATFEGVIRSTGRIWLATRMIAPLEWNQAGVAATLRVGKPFWASIPEAEWPELEESREKIKLDWDAQYGDRETEIVFVGIGIDKVRLQGLLDSCLLQDEEMVFNTAWENLEDPFVEWVPIVEDEDEPVTDEAGSLITESELTPVNPIVPDVNVEPQSARREKEMEKEDVDVSLSSDGSADNAEEVEDTETEVAEEELQNRDGEMGDGELPEEFYDEVTALDIFSEGFTGGSESNLVMQPADDGYYDQDDAVIASWEGSVADGILTQIPQTGLPVTILTGFLGSGKTTLLNFILTADHGLKIAVLVNEFGEIDIDNQLVQKGDWNSDEVFELSNGCICCDINDSFISAVEKILERKDQIDYLVVETTGVADPNPVVNSLTMTEVAEHVRLDGVLTLVDAENFMKTKENSETALAQILAADTILLSKTDIASRSEVDKVVKYLQEVRPAARILKSRRGRVPIDLILDVGLRIADSPVHVNPGTTEVEGDDAESGDTNVDEEQSNAHEEHAHAHDHDHEHEHSHDHDHEHDHDHDHDHDHKHDHEHGHSHDCGPDCTDESHSHNHLEADGFVTTSFKSDRPLDTRLFMDNFLRTLPDGVFRAKGLLYFHGFSDRYIFQLSGRRYHLQMDDWPENVVPGNQLVIIGRDLDLESLRETLEGCHAAEAE